MILVKTFSETTKIFQADIKCKTTSSGTFSLIMLQETEMSLQWLFLNHVRGNTDQGARDYCM